MTRLLLAAADAELEQRLRTALGAVNGSLLVVDPSALVAHLSRETPDALILGPEVAIADTLAFAARVDVDFPWVSVVLLADVAPDAWPDAMRAGVREIVSPTAAPEEIRRAVDRARQVTASRRQIGPSAVTATAPGAPTSGRVIAVVSPKGGVGKTTVASNLAVGLAQMAPLETVLVDLDVQFGDVASAMQLTPQRTLVDVVQGAAAKDALVLKSYLTTHPSGCYVVCGPTTPSEGDQISGEQVSALLGQLAAEFRYVVLDTAPGLGEHALAAIERATDAVVMCGMDVPGLLGVRKELAVLTELGMLPSSRHVLLNMADRRGGLSVRDVEASIGVPVDLVLPPSRAVPMSTNQGVPMLQSGSRDPVAKGLRALVRRLDPSYVAKDTPRAHRGTVLR